MNPEELPRLIADVLARKQRPTAWRMTRLAYRRLWANEPGPDWSAATVMGLPIEIVDGRDFRVELKTA